MRESPLEFLGRVLDINLGRCLGLLHPEKTHHASVEQVCDFCLHLHVDILDQHAVHDGNCFEINSELVQLFLMSLQLLSVGIEFDVVVGFVSCALPRKGTNRLLDVLLDGP